MRAAGLTREKCWVSAAPVMPTLSLSPMATGITFPIFSNWIITFPYFSVSLPASLTQVPGLGFSLTHSHPLLSTEDNYSVAHSLSLSWTAESSRASESLRHQLGSTFGSFPKARSSASLTRQLAPLSPCGSRQFHAPAPHLGSGQLPPSRLPSVQSPGSEVPTSCLPSVISASF